MRSIRPRHLVFLILICVIWGFNLVVSKVGLRELPPIFFTFLRFAILAVLLLPFLPVERKLVGALIVAATLSGGMSFGLMFYALSLTDNVGMMAISSQLGIPFSTLLSVALLGEVVHWRRWLGITMSFAGVLILALDADAFSQGVALMLSIAGAFCAALGLIVVKRLSGVQPLSLQAWTAMVSWPMLLALSLLLEHHPVAALAGAHWVTWAAIAYAVLFSSLLAHTGYYYLIQRYPVTAVAPVTVLSPVFSVLFAITLLGTAITPRLLIGGAVTLIGVAIIAARERKIVDTGS
jgi:O-acetylserine/cysteine efflux transporter